MCLVKRQTSVRDCIILFITYAVLYTSLYCCHTTKIVIYQKILLQLRCECIVHIYTIVTSTCNTPAIHRNWFNAIAASTSGHRHFARTPIVATVPTYQYIDEYVSEMIHCMQKFMNANAMNAFFNKELN